MRRTTLVSFVLVGLAGCASSLESAVEDARQAHRVPTGLFVVYDDRAPLLGGDRIEIAEDGSVRWWSDAPTPVSTGSAPEDAFDDVRSLPGAPSREPDRTGTVDAAAMQSLLALLESIAPWDGVRDDEDDMRLERRRAYVSVRRGDDSETSWQWADPTETGDERITSIRRWAEASVPRPAVAPPESTEPEDEGPNPVLRNP